MLFSVVDDRSGVAYQEYRCVYGEDVESALRFLFNAMAPKETSPLQGIPAMLYLDNGPVAKPRFRRDGDSSASMAHAHARRVGRQRHDARSKGKVERPFRTVKEAHETLYHFHKPQNEAEANPGCATPRPLQRQAAPARAALPGEDWLANLPEAASGRCAPGSGSALCART